MTQQNGVDASPNIALLIDADNAAPASLDPVLTILAELGTVNIRRAYGNWSKPGLKTWANLTLKNGIEPQQQFDVTKGKNATDMKMTIDAMDLLFSGRVHGFGLMSSDSDFMPLAMRIRQNGVPVYGFGSATTPEAFRQACTRFIDVGALVAARKGPEAAAAPARPAKATPAARPTAAVRTDAAKAEDVKADPEVPAFLAMSATGPTKKVDDELLKLLIDAYDAVKRDEAGFARLATVGQLAGNRSSFDVRNYGFKQLSDLIEKVPNFVSERRDGGQVYIKRVR